MGEYLVWIAVGAVVVFFFGVVLGWLATGGEK